MQVLNRKNEVRIPRASFAEKVGVDSKEVQAFIDDCKESGIEIHSLMVTRHGQVACEAYKEPFSPDIPHTMYSVSKSFTSIAVGFAIEEGYMTLETKFLDVFPEYRPEKYDPYLEKLNVFHLLTMQSGKSLSPMADRTKDTWIKDFVKGTWGFEPGTQFLYVSENMYILCSMIRKLTGKTVTEWLTPRLYEPLGMEVPYWETCPHGTEAGGWGLFITMEDFAKVTLCCQQMGKFNGKQVIPAEWIEVGTKKIADNSEDGNNIDGVNGYGYCFWRCGGYKNAYRMDGMFGQFGIVFEDLDAILNVMAGNIDEQQLRDAIWRHFPKAFIEDTTDAQGVEVKFEPYPKMPKLTRSFMEKSLDSKVITFGKAHVLTLIGMPVSVLPLAAVFMEKDKAGNIDNVSFRFYEDEMLMTWTEGVERNTIKVGLDGEYRYGRIVLGGIAYTTASTAAWTSERVLEVHIRPVETVAERQLIFTFKGEGKVTMEPSTTPPSSVMLDNVKSSVKEIMTSEFIGNLAELVIPLANPFADPTYYGKIK